MIRCADFYLFKLPYATVASGTKYCNHAYCAANSSIDSDHTRSGNLSQMQVHHEPVSSGSIGPERVPHEEPALKLDDGDAVVSVKPPRGRVLDVIEFGADETGSKPSDAAINAAIALINERGGQSTLLFRPGVYRVDAPLTPVAGQDITISGSGATIDWTNTTDTCPGRACPCLLAFVAMTETRTRLATDVGKGVDTLQVTDPVAPGQFLRLNSSELYYTTTRDSVRNNKKGELLVSTATFGAPTRLFAPDGKSPIFSYNRSLTSATIVTPSRNILVHGLSVRGAGAELMTIALSVSGARGVTISGCSFDRLMAAIGVDTSHLVLVSQVCTDRGRCSSCCCYLMYAAAAMYVVTPSHTCRSIQPACIPSGLSETAAVCVSVHLQSCRSRGLGLLFNGWDIQHRCANVWLHWRSRAPFYDHHRRKWYQSRYLGNWQHLPWLNMLCYINPFAGSLLSFCCCCWCSCSCFCPRGHTCG